MAYATQATGTNSGLSTTWFASAVESGKAALRRHAAYRRTVNELEAYNDRELTDMGLSRSMIRVLAREAAQNT